MRSACAEHKEQTRADDGTFFVKAEDLTRNVDAAQVPTQMCSYRDETRRRKFY